MSAESVADSIPLGYKQTEGGVIPEDWSAKTWGDVIIHCFSGATPSRSRPDFFKGDIRWITSGELNYKIINDTYEKITQEAVEKTNLKILPKNTFLMAITGLEAEGTRGSCAIVGEESTTNQSCMAIFPNEELKVEYLFHYYVFKGKELALQYCQGTKQQSYTAKIVKLLPITVPPLPEQESIATALSYTDALIESLEQLIAKKRQIKQGAMQELLTGKRRLPGFSGKWRVEEIRNVLNLIMDYRGRTPKKLGMDWGGGDILALSAGNVKMGNIDFSVDAYFGSEELYRKWMTQGDTQINDVLITTEAPLGNVALIPDSKKYILSQRTILLRSNSQILDSKFLFHMLISTSFQELLKKDSSGSTATGIQRLKFEKINISFPSLPEQAAIATILSDMDAEITSLEEKLAKTRQIKQAMMQELLTGRVRLV